MFLISKPNGKILIGETTENLDAEFLSKVGDAAIFRKWSDNSTNVNPIVVGSATSDWSITTETVETSDLPNYTSSEKFPIYADVYKKDNLVKVVILADKGNYKNNMAYNSTKIKLGTVHRTGDTTDLTGYEKVNTVAVINNFYSLPTANLVSITTNIGFINVKISLSTRGFNLSKEASTTPTEVPGAFVETQSVSVSLTKELDDIKDTVSDLSSESAAKFVSR